MLERPELHTERLLLRPFSLADAPAVQALAGEKEIAATTLTIPHPYEDGMAEEWIGTHQEAFEKGESIIFAVARLSDGALIGAVGLEINPQNVRGELGYWIGVPYWNQGYCTEAARAVVNYGFEQLGLARIHAAHFKRNLASGRVLQKLGMTHEGNLRKHVLKWYEFEDLELYGICKEDRRINEHAFG
jgi:ribosomal-protein-alanine N-acetyltransferase